MVDITKRLEAELKKAEGEDKILRESFINVDIEYSIGQYTNFFLSCLEELLRDAFSDEKLVKCFMNPYNESYQLLIYCVSNKLLTRRNMDKILQQMTLGDNEIISYINTLKAAPMKMGLQLCISSDNTSDMTLAMYEKLIYLTATKLEHLLRYEQRYLGQHRTNNSCMDLATFDVIVTPEHFSEKEETCKSKERPEFRYGAFYVYGCRGLVRRIHEAMIYICERIGCEVMLDILHKSIALFNVVSQVENLVNLIIKSSTIKKSELGASLIRLHTCIIQFNNVLKLIVPNIRATMDGKSYKVLTKLRYIFTDLVCLEWGFRFLGLTYSSAYINQDGIIKMRHLRKGVIITKHSRKVKISTYETDFFEA